MGLTDRKASKITHRFLTTFLSLIFAGVSHSVSRENPNSNAVRGSASSSLRNRLSPISFYLFITILINILFMQCNFWFKLFEWRRYLLWIANAMANRMHEQHDEQQQLPHAEPEEMDELQLPKAQEQMSTIITFQLMAGHLLRPIIYFSKYFIIQLTLLLLIHFDCFKCTLFSLITLSSSSSKSPPPQQPSASSHTPLSTLQNVDAIKSAEWHLAENVSTSAFIENTNTKNNNITNDNKCKGIIIDNKFKLDNNNISFCSANQQAARQQQPQPNELLL